ncbi:hypothetical protein ABMA27_012179 [Loxostege sticticalis]|uniref:Uncharacterized protein n=1 Tax=Loxostege sticticalis TaxID=481309 RepID=A0ABR3H0E3_LOXSC
MPSQDSIAIASIFDDIEEHNLKYCCICFRTEEERKLVYGDTHFLKCLKFMDVWTAAAPFPYIGDTAGLQTPAAVPVCYVCEAETTRAYALFQAINFARIINQFFRDVACRVKFKANIPTHLDRHIGKQRNYCGVRPQADWWRRLRARSNLVQTEVLVVTDHQDEDLNATVPQARASRAADRPPSPRSGPPPRAPEPDNIVIIDDDEDPLDVPPPPLTPMPPIPPTPTPKVVPLHRLLEANATPNEDMITSDLPKKNLSGYILQPLVLAADGTYHIAGTTIRNGPIQQIQHNTIQNTPNTRQRNTQKYLEIEPLDLDSDNSLSAVIIESDQCMNGLNISNIQTLSDGILVDEDGQERGEAGKEEKSGGGVEKRPVMTGTRIDWEDKIPMDVISFVDATDPLINKNSSTQTPPRKRHKDNFVDLS